MKADQTPISPMMNADAVTHLPVLGWVGQPLSKFNLVINKPVLFTYDTRLPYKQTLVEFSLN